MAGGSKVQTTRSEPWEAQKPFLTEGFEKTAELYGAGKMAPAYYGTSLNAAGDWVTDPGMPTLAGFSGPEVEAQTMALDYARNQKTQDLMGLSTSGLGGMLQYGAGAMGAGETAAQPLTQTQYSTFTPFNQYQYQDLLAGRVDTDTGPFKDVADVYGRQAMNQLTGQVLPGIRSAITQSQAGGGTRGDIIQANAVAAANQQMTDNIAKAQFDAYNQAQAMRMPSAQMGLGAQQQRMAYGMQGADATRGALGQYPSTLTAPLSMAGAVGDVGLQQRQMAQTAIDRDMGRYEYQAQLPMNALQNYLAGISGEYGGTSQTVGAGGPSPMMGIMAGLAGRAMGLPI